MDDNNNMLCGDLFSQDLTITQLDSLPTQEFLSVVEVNNIRFENVNPSTTDDLERRKIERLPKSTSKRNCWAMSAYEDWANWRNSKADTLLGDTGAVPNDLWNQYLECMNFWLSRFIVECRRKDGTLYPPNTLYNITASIQRTLRDQYGRNEVKILDTSDINFADFRKLLDARMKELNNQDRNVTDCLTRCCRLHRPYKSQISELWRLFYNCKLFGFRGGDEQRELQADQYRITEKNGQNV